VPFRRSILGVKLYAVVAAEIARVLNGVGEARWSDWLPLLLSVSQLQVQAQQKGQHIFIFLHAVGSADGGVEGGLGVAEAVGAGGFEGAIEVARGPAVGDPNVSIVRNCSLRERFLAIRELFQEEIPHFGRNPTAIREVMCQSIRTHLEPFRRGEEVYERGLGWPRAGLTECSFDENVGHQQHGGESVGSLFEFYGSPRAGDQGELRARHPVVEKVAQFVSQRETPS
jgi:hypothetical protein